MTLRMEGGFFLKIANYYRGGTERLSGFIADTDAKTYKSFSLKGDQWRDGKMGVDDRMKKGFGFGADIEYYFPTKTDMECQRTKYELAGFTEDDTKVLDFGIGLAV